MTKEESYRQEYNKMNHAYNEIFDSFEILQEADDADRFVIRAMNDILNAYSNILDIIKDGRNLNAPKPEKEDMNDAGTGKKGLFGGWSVK